MQCSVAHIYFVSCIQDAGKQRVYACMLCQKDVNVIEVSVWRVFGDVPALTSIGFHAGLSNGYIL